MTRPFKRYDCFYVKEKRFDRMHRRVNDETSLKVLEFSSSSPFQHFFKKKQKNGTRAHQEIWITSFGVINGKELEFYIYFRYPILC